MYSCVHCYRGFDTMHDLRSHQRDHVAEGWILEKPPKSKSETDFLFNCHYCNFNTDRKMLLRSHMTKHMRSLKKFPYECGTCGFRGASLFNVENHKQVHSDYKPFECHHCAHTTKTLFHLKSHIERVHLRLRPFSCVKCDYRATRREQIKSHMATKHGGKTQFRCYQCNYKTVSLKLLQSHEIVHSGQKKFACKECNYSTNFRKDIRNHMTIHTGWKPYQCSLCDYKCCSITYLKIHMRVHTGERPFKCDVCQKTFSHRSTLRKHIDGHYSVYRYKCTFCSYKTQYQTAFNYHEKLHQGERPHNCPHCPKRFADLYNLNSHMRTHTGEAPFSCGVCQQSFCFRGSWKDHLKKCDPFHPALEAQRSRIQRLPRKEATQGIIAAVASAKPRSHMKTILDFINKNQVLSSTDDSDNAGDNEEAGSVVVVKKSPASPMVISCDSDTDDQESLSTTPMGASLFMEEPHMNQLKQPLSESDCDSQNAPLAKPSIAPAPTKVPSKSPLKAVHQPYQRSLDSDVHKVLAATPKVPAGPNKLPARTKYSTILIKSRGTPSIKTPYQPNHTSDSDSDDVDTLPAKPSIAAAPSKDPSNPPLKAVHQPSFGGRVLAATPKIAAGPIKLPARTFQSPIIQKSRGISSIKASYQPNHTSDSDSDDVEVLVASPKMAADPTRESCRAGNFTSHQKSRYYQTYEVSSESDTDNQEAVLAALIKAAAKQPFRTQYHALMNAANQPVIPTDSLITKPKTTDTTMKKTIGELPRAPTQQSLKSNTLSVPPVKEALSTLKQPSNATGHGQINPQLASTSRSTVSTTGKLVGNCRILSPPSKLTFTSKLVKVYLPPAASHSPKPSANLALDQVQALETSNTDDHSTQESIPQTNEMTDLAFLLGTDSATDSVPGDHFLSIPAVPSPDDNDNMYDITYQFVNCDDDIGENATI